MVKLTIPYPRGYRHIGSYDIGRIGFYMATVTAGIPQSNSRRAGWNCRYGLLERERFTKGLTMDSRTASPLFKISEAADYLRVGPKKIHDLCNAGRLTRFKIGSLTFIHFDDLNTFIESQRASEV